MRTPAPLVQALYDEFRGLVYASGRPYSRGDFADAYGQTVIFGLLLALITGGTTVSTHMAATQVGPTQHPFLARCLQLLTDPSLPPDLKGPLEEAVTAINRIPPSLFQSPGQTEPILYAYEQFSAAYDPPNALPEASITRLHMSSLATKSPASKRLLQDAFGASGLTNPSSRTSIRQPERARISSVYSEPRRGS